MELIDYQILHRDLQLGVILPVVVIEDDLAAHLPALGFLLPPEFVTADQFGVRVQQRSIWIETQTFFRGVLSEESPGVLELLRVLSEYHDRVVAACPECIGHGDVGKCFFRPLVVQDELTALGVHRVD